MKKILLIEDNLEVRENTAEILSLANYEVLTAENGKVGVKLAFEKLPDLIICDIMMPELDGYGVLHILGKDATASLIPFIFLTAKAEKSEIRKGMNLGADDYLTKPFDDTELLNAVEARLNKQSMRTKEYHNTLEGLDNFIIDAQKILKLNDLCKDRKLKHFKKKSEIFMEGDLPLNIFFVKSGNVKTFKSNQDGKELITNLYGPSDFFGFEPIIENIHYRESAVALEDTEIVQVPKQDFLTLLFGQPDVSSSFIGLLCKKVADKENQLLNLAYNSVRQRIAEALLKLAEGKTEKDNIHISREDLAKIVGTAPESVIRGLSDFKEEKLIEIESGKIRVIHPKGLGKVVRWNVAL